MSRWKPFRFHLGTRQTGLSVRLLIPVWSWSWLQIRISTILLLILAASVYVAWQRDHTTLSDKIIELEVELSQIQNVKTSWSIQQLLGPPDTAGFGDIVTAWASASADGQAEWIIAHFEEEVSPSQLHIYETYNPGAVNKVSVFTPLGNEVVVWQGTDPTPPTSAGGTSKIPLQTIWRTKKVKVYLDSPNVAGWNEIDAIGLLDQQGNTQWTRYAEASSSYGTTNASGPMVPGPVFCGVASTDPY